MNCWHTGWIRSLSASQDSDGLCAKQSCPFSGSWCISVPGETAPLGHGQRLLLRPISELRAQQACRREGRWLRLPPLDSQRAANKWLQSILQESSALLMWHRNNIKKKNSLSWRVSDSFLPTRLCSLKPFSLRPVNNSKGIAGLDEIKGRNNIGLIEAFFLTPLTAHADGDGDDLFWVLAGPKEASKELTG